VLLGQLKYHNYYGNAFAVYTIHYVGY